MDWSVVTKTGASGSSCAQSGDILDYQMTGIETTVTGPGTLTFSWNVSCCDYNGLYFSDNGDDKADICGTDQVWLMYPIMLTRVTTHSAGIT